MSHIAKILVIIYTFFYCKTLNARGKSLQAYNTYISTASLFYSVTSTYGALFHNFSNFSRFLYF